VQFNAALDYIGTERLLTIALSFTFGFRSLRLCRLQVGDEHLRPGKPISQHIGLFTRPLQSGKVSRPKPLQATHARYRERDEVGVGITVLDN
jgi:hypothetical protein